MDGEKQSPENNVIDLGFCYRNYSTFALKFTIPPFPPLD